MGNCADAAHRCSKARLKLDDDNFYPDLVKKMQGETRRLQRRLAYVELQLTKEAKFLPRDRCENNRFYRAYDTVTEIKDSLGNLAALRGPWTADGG